MNILLTLYPALALIGPIQGLIRRQRLTRLLLSTSLCLLPWIVFCARGNLFDLTITWYISVIGTLAATYFEAAGLKAETVTKVSTHHLVSCFLVFGALSLFELHQSIQFDSQSIWMNLNPEFTGIFVSALLGAALLVIAGIPPLQQAWIDFGHVYLKGESARLVKQLLLLCIFVSLILMRWLVDFSVPSMQIIVGSLGLCGLIGSRLITSVQLNKWRGLSHQASMVYLPLFAGASVSRFFKNDSENIWMLSEIMIALMFSLICIFIEALNSDDCDSLNQDESTHIFYKEILGLRKLQILDLSQGIIYLALAIYAGSLMTMILLVAYLLSVACCLSVRTAETKIFTS